MGASEQSVEWKLKQESEYLKKIKEENQKKNQNISSSIANSIFEGSPNFPLLFKSKVKSSLNKPGNISQQNKKINKTKKFNLNIIYYDEHLRDSEENSDNCSFIEMNTNGTFYGCHNYTLFQTVHQKLVKSQKEFILISSGSCAEKIFNYCRCTDEIREYYIYCFLKEKYFPLMSKFPKLKGVYNIFSELKEKLYNIKEIPMDYISSSNLIFFEDYSKLYIKLHYEFIRKYSLYKLLKSQNCNEADFLQLVEKKFPYFLDLARQLFPDKKETIDFFIKNADESEKTVREVFECDDNILNDNIKSYIQNYTKESFYYKYLNRFLRQGNFEAFRTLSSHIAKFIFKLYDYREKNLENQKKSNLYRRMYLKQEDIKLYEKSINRVICFPSFTSTSIGKDNFTPFTPNPDTQLVLLIIEQNNTKSVVSLREYSVYQNEEEYLFLPFSFFKITKVELKQGNASDPHIIHLIALNSDKPVEDLFCYFIKNETDNLNPEGLDFLLLTDNNTKIIFNDIYLSKNN